MRRRVLAALLPVLLAAAGCDAAPPAPVRVEPLPAIAADAPGLPPEDTFLAEIDKTRGTRDMFPVVRDPELVPAASAGLASTEQVLGLDLGTVAVAYPVNLLNHHEIVEHTLAGLDLLVCW